jgi:hypothetical protein
MMASFVRCHSRNCRRIGCCPNLTLQITEWTFQFLFLYSRQERLASRPSYGVAPHAFSDYFQMSRQYARDCCKHFARIVTLLYTKEFLRVPTKDDLKNIAKPHEKVHGTAGLLGSLDCTHTHWKNCPKGWQGRYKGKENKPTIVMEAMSDYNLFFWHASYGYTGTLQLLSWRWRS